MHAISQLQQLVNESIEEKKFNGEPKELYEPINYLMTLGGKRIRPVLLLVATDLFGGSILGSLDAAVAIEVFHNFTLVHDDIMDKAPLRRGFATVHEKWNGNIAILSGDVMLVEAYRLMATVEPSRLKPVLDLFSTTAAEVCRGQQTDMNFEQADNVPLTDYLEMIRLKTAVLLGCSLQIGALLAGADEHDAQRLYAFGENLGLAFQLQDDILDVFGDAEKFGKQIGGDILSNKKTYLLIKALEIAEDLDREELLSWLSQEEPEPAAKIEAVTALYLRLGVRQLAENQMTTFAEKALQLLAEINAPEDRKVVLRNFADALLIREN